MLHICWALHLFLIKNRCGGNTPIIRFDLCFSLKFFLTLNLIIGCYNNSLLGVAYIVQHVNAICTDRFLGWYSEYPPDAMWIMPPWLHTVPCSFQNVYHFSCGYHQSDHGVYCLIFSKCELTSLHQLIYLAFF